jgi:hypothetical protein
VRTVPAEVQELPATAEPEVIATDPYSLAFAVASGWLDTNPLTGRRLPLAGGGGAIDPRVVVNPARARHLLASVTYVVAPVDPTTATVGGGCTPSSALCITRVCVRPRR